ncbi:MAG: lipoyl(octanoyl) transferase LipB [Rhodobacteraceae bacterium]|nr:lipoyl(octanoyl) transferase LipB [Paracoccaceae bacterium]
MVQFIHSSQLIDYPAAVQEMESIVNDIVAGSTAEALWFLEHKPIYTFGTSSNHEDLLIKDHIPVYKSGRGGKFTYHGPGQRVVYLMLNLNNRGKNVRQYVDNIQKWVLMSLKDFGLVGTTYPDRIGIWIAPQNNPTIQNLNVEKKIGAVGIRIRKWVSFHGISINVNPDLGYFDGIVPCGIREFGVTSFSDLGFQVSLNELDDSLERNFNKVF